MGFCEKGESPLVLGLVVGPITRCPLDTTMKKLSCPSWAQTVSSTRLTALRAAATLQKDLLKTLCFLRGAAPCDLVLQQADHLCDAFRPSDLIAYCGCAAPCSEHGHVGGRLAEVQLGSRFLTAYLDARCSSSSEERTTSGSPTLTGPLAGEITTANEPNSGISYPALVSVPLQ